MRSRFVKHILISFDDGTSVTRDFKGGQAVLIERGNHKPPPSKEPFIECEVRWTEEIKDQVDPSKVAALVEDDLSTVREGTIGE